MAVQWDEDSEPSLYETSDLLIEINKRWEPMKP
jgi:hypothetical protein